MRTDAFHLREARKKRGFPLYREFLPRAFALSPRYPWWANTFRLRSTALRMEISRAQAHSHNVCASLRSHHTCGDGVCCTGMIMLGCLFCFVFEVCFDFYLQGRLFRKQRLGLQTSFENAFPSCDINFGPWASNSGKSLSFYLNNAPTSQILSHILYILRQTEENMLSPRLNQDLE